MSLTCAENSTSSFRSKTPTWCRFSSASSAKDAPPWKTATLASTLPDALTRSATTLSGDRERTKNPPPADGALASTKLGTGPEQSGRARAASKECASSSIPFSSDAGRTPRQSKAFCALGNFSKKSGPAAAGLLIVHFAAGQVSDHSQPPPLPNCSPPPVPEGAAPPHGTSSRLQVTYPRLAHHPYESKHVPPFRSGLFPYGTPAHRYR